MVVLIMPANPDNQAGLICSRTCNVCHVEYPRTAEFWNRQPRRSDGLDETCKLCAKRRAREWYAANRDRARETRQQYARNNREQYLAGKIRYRLANLDRIKAKDHEWKAANRGRIRDWGVQYRAANADSIAAKKHADYVADPESVKLRAHEWFKANPDRVSIRTARRRTAERNAPGHYTEDDLIKQFEAQRGMCFYCQEDLDGRGTIDHYIPLSKGGTNYPSNIVLACWPCNNEKRAKLPGEFRPRKQSNA